MAEVTRGPMKDSSGTITLGGTAEPLMDENLGRSNLLIQNQDSTDPIWVDFDGVTAVESQPSIQIPAGVAYEREGVHIPTGAISIVGPTTNQAFTAKEG